MTSKKTISMKDKKFDNQKREYTLNKSPEFLVIRFKPDAKADAEKNLARLPVEIHSKFEAASVFVIRVSDPSTTDNIKSSLLKNPDTRFVGHAFLINDEPVVYTENIIIIFNDNKSESDCRRFFSEKNLTVKQHIQETGSTWLVTPQQSPGSDVFELSKTLLDAPDVEACYPEIVQLKKKKVIHPNQWHLKPTLITWQAVINASANVEEAHKFTRGEGIVIAIIDDAVDITHPEFSSPGKVVNPANFSGRVFDTNPMPDNARQSHGTPCAGVAASSGLYGATGVAPAAHIMPVKYTEDLGSLNEARQFIWAADRGADVISCSWGPLDGDPLVEGDPLHHRKFPLAPHVRRAIEYAATRGRNGKGCAIFFAAGNGNESVDNDGYASCPYVMAVAACNSENIRSYYSDYGKAIFCAFPSNDLLSTSTPGIWTTSLTRCVTHTEGTLNKGDVYGNYTNNFGGTSSACPGAAGVAALVLSVYPDISLDELRSILRKTCDKIGQQGPSSDKNFTTYDRSGHSLALGYGRLNAGEAVKLALKRKKIASANLHC
ncbi:S8 family serine peptidase [Erwinia sp. E602]|uniref:S8 family peptidase n=1 Tax=Erwinia sp. E602 TaxID=2675378 RepID=UPI001BA53FD6|nr:S8 family serine peptidase [Erwinia sp. E602]QUG75363.1 S8 family serine peptidase [Erwinia sp. E602]